MRSAVLAVALSLVLPGFAIAALPPPGVTYDPDSPAGKEYALPLESARSRVSGEDGANRAVGEAPLFGGGVQPETRTGEAEAAGEPTSGDDDGGGDGEGGVARPGGDGGDPPSGRSDVGPVATLEPGGQESATSRAATGGLVAFLVAAIGLGAGFAGRAALRS